MEFFWVLVSIVNFLLACLFGIHPIPKERKQKRANYFRQSIVSGTRARNIRMIDVMNAHTQLIKYRRRSARRFRHHPRQLSLFSYRGTFCFPFSNLGLHSQHSAATTATACRYTYLPTYLKCSLAHAHAIQTHSALLF